MKRSLPGLASILICVVAFISACGGDNTNGANVAGNSNGVTGGGASNTTANTNASASPSDPVQIVSRTYVSSVLIDSSVVFASNRTNFSPTDMIHLSLTFIHPSGYEQRRIVAALVVDQAEGVAPGTLVAQHPVDLALRDRPNPILFLLPARTPRGRGTYHIEIYMTSGSAPQPQLLARIDGIMVA